MRYRWAAVQVQATHESAFAAVVVVYFVSATSISARTRLLRMCNLVFSNTSSDSSSDSAPTTLLWHRGKVSEQGALVNSENGILWSPTLSPPCPLVPLVLDESTVFGMALDQIDLLSYRNFPYRSLGRSTWTFNYLLEKFYTDLKYRYRSTK